MESDNNNKTYRRRLDFYWQFIAVYAVVLIMYALVRGLVIEDNFDIGITDPLSILFSVFIFITLLTVLYHELMKKTITISEDGITLKHRFREKFYSTDDIIRISFSKDRRVRVKRAVRIVKIRLKGRRFPLRIRLSAFWDEKELYKDLIDLKKKLRN